MCVTVAVSKYSHAIGEKHDNRNNVTIPWIHHEASDIFLVLKDEDTYIQNGRLSMQVVQGNAALVRNSDHSNPSESPNAVIGDRQRRRAHRQVDRSANRFAASGNHAANRAAPHLRHPQRHLSGVSLSPSRSRGFISHLQCSRSPN